MKAQSSFATLLAVALTSLHATLATATPLAAPAPGTVVALPDAMTEVNYDENLGFSGGTPRYDEFDDPYFEYEVVSGNFPDCLAVYGRFNADASSIAIDGTPDADAAGTYNFTIQIDGDGGESAMQAYSLIIVENPDHRPVIESRTPDSSPVRVAPGSSETFSVTATDEDGDELSYAWRLYDGEWDWIEDCDSTTNSWVFDASGRPNGRYYAYVRITGSNLWTDTSWRMDVADPLAAPDTNRVVALPDALTDAKYNGNLGFTGGVPCRHGEDDDEYFSCAVIVGRLPDGLRIQGRYGNDTSSLRVEGTPEADAVGTYDFTVRVIGDYGEQADQSYTLTVAENPDHRPVIESKTPATYRVRIEPGASETFSVAATDEDNDELSYEWTLCDNDWDWIDDGDSTTNGWVFNASEFGEGYYHIRVRVTGSSLGTNASWYVVVTETKPLAAPNTNGVVALPDAVTGVEYEDGNLGITGGVPFYGYDEEGGDNEYFTYEVVSGELPEGLSVQGRYNDNASTVEIGGTPEDETAGDYAFTIRIVGDGGETVEQAYTLSVVQNAEPVIERATPAASDVTIRAGTTATFGIKASDLDGDALAVTWKLYDDWGDPISNLTPETNGTVLFSRGVGDYSIKAQVYDGFHTVNRWWYVTVVATNDLVADVSLPDAVAGEPYSATFSVTGGTEPYSWSLPDCADPLPAAFAPGLSFSEDGTVSGTPTTPGTYHVSVAVIDDAGTLWSGTAVFHVEEAIPPPPLAPALATYKVNFNANGGTGKMSAQTIACNATEKLNANAFKRTGWIFIGWAKTKTGTAAYKDQAAVKNLAASGKSATLYAQWAKKSYKVKFCHTYKNETGTMKAQTMTYGKPKKLSANKFKREGYKFKGWATSKAQAKKAKVKYTNKKKVKNLVTNGKTVKLYAVWKKN